MHLKSTVHTAASSYISTFSSIAIGLITIRVATQFLGKEEFGLWSFTLQTVGYLLLLDLGVSGSISRLFGEPLASGDQGKMDSWFTLCLITLLCQALLIMVLGLAVRPFVLRWFNIPSHLVAQASILWILFLCVRSFSLVFTICYAILHAQNRVFWTNIVQMGGAWAGLVSFAYMLWQGYGVMAYGWSTAIAAISMIIGSVLAVKRGHHHFSLSLKGVTRKDLRRLYGFSSTVFVTGLASQIYYASHGLVVTKLLGLETAAVLAVTMRAVAIANSAIWKPLDAFAPRWQVAYCNHDIPRVADEFNLMARFTILLAVSGAIGIAICNQPFICWWTKPDFFGGQMLNYLLAGFVVVQGINRCFVALFPLTLHMRGYTVVNLASVVVAIGLMIVFTRWWGLPGIPAGLLATDLMFPMWYYLIAGGRRIGVIGLKILVRDAAYWLPCLGLSFGIAAWLARCGFHSNLQWLLVALGCAALCAGPLLWLAYALIRKLRNSAA